MKASLPPDDPATAAPPPPTDPPPADPAPVAADGASAEPPPSPEATAPSPPPQADTPPTPSGPPDWYPVADGLMAALVLVAAFLAASFPARNSDVWLHLASGRLIASGQYPVGGDPFSHTGADRPWANSCWLFDLGLYAAYSAAPDGAAAVAVKAAAFAAAFGLLLLMRRGGQPLWPWAAAAAAGVLAAAPSGGQLRPAPASVFFLAGTLLLVNRAGWGGWRTPLLLAALFALWANVDGWFLLGPFALLLLLVGELLHNVVVGPDKGPVSPDDPLGPPPPTAGLSRALLVGTAACFLNPMVLAALARNPGEALGQLVPVELAGLPPPLASDPEVLGVTLSPLSETFLSSPQFGYNLNGAAVGALAVATTFALAVGYGRARLSHVVLVVGFAWLAARQYRLIPYFAVVVVPVVAGYLNGLSSQLPAPASAAGRVLATLSGVGRIVSVTAAGLMLAAAWPGWLHPQPGDRAFAQRVEWKVEPDPGPVRVAEAIQGWRSSNRLPADAHGMATSLEHGNYAAWFAPAEKVFANSRWRFHRTELADHSALRRAVGVTAGVGTAGDDDFEADAFKAVTSARSVGYVVASAAGRRPVDLADVLALLDRAGGWGLWHLDGRAAVVGKLGLGEAGDLGFSPVREAFGPAVRPLPPAPLSPPVGEMPFLEGYAHRPAPPPAEADDGLIYVEYARRLQYALGAARAAVVGVTAADALPIPGDPRLPAAAVLAVRSAHRAMAAAPDRAEGYAALAEAVKLPFLPAAHPDDARRRLPTALVRYLSRVPPPSAVPPAAGLVAYRQYRLLADIYRSGGQLDFQRRAFNRAVEYAAVAAADPRLFVPAAGGGSPGDRFLAGVRAEQDQIATLVARQTERWKQATGRADVPPAAKFQAAAQAGLPLTAIDLFEQAKGPDVFGPDAPAVALRMIELKLNAGLLEEAAANLAAFEEEVQKFADRAAGLQAGAADLRTQVDRLAGNYQAAIDATATRAAGRLPQFPPAARRLAADLDRVSAGLFAAAGGPSAVWLAGRADGPQAVRAALEAEAGFHFHLGLLAVLAGNRDEAVARFERAARPQGADLAAVGDPARAAEARAYLRLLRAAAP